MINEKDVRRVWNASLSSNGYRLMIDDVVYNNAPRIAKMVNEELQASGRIDIENVITEVIAKALDKGLA